MQNLFDISGKVALVTGGSRGIGEMIARGYVAAGAKVYISSRSVDACEALAAELSKEGECIALPFDLGTMDGVEALAAALAEKEEKLDILVNNAGANWAAPIDEFPEAGWDKVMTVNLKSIFFLTQKLLPLLRNAATEESPARVINTASINGMTPTALETYSYQASKSGLIHLTRSLAKRLAAEDICVNAIAPGPFQSKMMAATLDAFGEQIAKSNPRKRIGTPEDAAGVCIFLASRASAYITGATIAVDGGIVSCAVPEL